MVRLVLRRNRVRLAVWWRRARRAVRLRRGVLQGALPHPGGARRLRRASATSPSIKALTGLAAAPDTLGGAVWTKIWMTCALILAFGVVFLVTRNGRADEEVGRTELLRSRMLGLHAYSAASWLVNGVAVRRRRRGRRAASRRRRARPGRHRRHRLARSSAPRSPASGWSRSASARSPARWRPPRAAPTRWRRPSSACFYVAADDRRPRRRAADLGLPDRLGPVDAAVGRATGGGRSRCCSLLDRRAARRRHPARGARATSAPACCPSARARPRRPPGTRRRSGSALRLQRGPIIGWTVTVVLSRPAVRLGRRGDDRPARRRRRRLRPTCCEAPASRRCCPARRR